MSVLGSFGAELVKSGAGALDAQVMGLIEAVTKPDYHLSKKYGLCLSSVSD
jgi:hypothetical protein